MASGSRRFGVRFVEIEQGGRHTGIPHHGVRRCAGETERAGGRERAGAREIHQQESGRETRSRSLPVRTRSPAPTGEVAARPPPSRAAACAGCGHVPPIGADLQHLASSVPPSSCSVQSPSVPPSIKQEEQHIWRREGSKRQRGVEAERQWRTRERERGAAALEREDWEFER